MPAPPSAVLDLLGCPRVRIEPLDPRGQPWRLATDAWTAVLRRSTASLEHIAWLHRFLDRLGQTGFPAPRPLPLLNGASLAAYQGMVWETLSFLPGRPLGYDPRVPLESAGALLARFHQVSLTISPPIQRPQALPMEACRPRSEQRIADSFQRDLAAIGHHSAARCVLHGDCTVANIVVDAEARGVVAMIDVTLAHLGPSESDISFGLWVNGRTHQPALTLDEHRVRAFVAGYHRVRPLGEWAVRAIPLYLVGRGLQMRVRQERVGIWDEIQVNRLRWLHAHRGWLEDVVASALGSANAAHSKPSPDQ